jgi:hypothetical protein
MPAAVTPEQSIAVFGMVGPTSTADVAQALRHFGLHPASKLRRLGRDQAIPSPSMLKIVQPGQSTFHWVVFHQGEI